MITVKPFCSSTDGQLIELFTLTNSSGMCAGIINQGAALVSLQPPDRAANFREVLRQYATPEEYLANNAYLGAIVGRYANRIAKSQFTLDDNVYKLNANLPKFTLHGGTEGFSQRFWDAKIVGNTLEMSLESPDGDQGFPGHLRVKVVYALHDDNALTIDYYAESDRATVINLTNHAYFNLSGSGGIDEHEFFINADSYTESDVNKIPTGTILSLDNTTLDLREPANIAAVLRECSGELALTRGFDHNYILNHNCASLRVPAATASSATTGIVMELFTTEPAVQFYTSLGLDGKYNSFCFEAQHFPDSPNHADFPSTTLRAGDIYRQNTVLRFNVI